MIWTDYEIEYLEENIADQPISEIAQHLSRSCEEVELKKNEIYPRIYKSHKDTVGSIAFGELVGLISQDYDYYQHETSSYGDNNFALDDSDDFDDWDRLRQEYDERMGRIWEENSQNYFLKEEE